jgi:O-glycosyl hydrolase
MKNTVLILTTAFCLGSFAQVQVTIDPTTKKQTISGLGTCTGGAEYKDHLNDLGSSMIRLSLVGTAGMEETANDNSDPNNLDLSKFTWAQGTIDIAKAAHLKKTKIIVNAFTPPVWMKDNGDLNNGGHLLPGMYEEYGEWALGCAKSFKIQAGFDMYSFGTQNEPEFPEPYPSCIYDAAQLMKASRWIGRKFDSAGVNVKIFHGEILFNQGNALKFFQAVNNDSSCKKYVDEFAIHISDGDGLNVSGTGSGSNWYKLCYNESQRVAPKKEFWLTEDSYVPLDGPTMDDALLEACHFYNGMYYGNLTSWLYCGGYNTKKDVPVYSLYKQLIRFIRPNSVRVQSSSNNASVYTLAFKNDSNNSFVMVLINKDTTDKTVNISLPASPGNFDIFRTSEKEWCEFAGTTNLTGLVLPAKSVSTLINIAGNKLPTINNIDTVVLIKNTSGKINLSGITDGGEGNQTVSLSVYSTMPYFNTLSLSYTSPSTTGDINYSCNSSSVGTTQLAVTIDDHSAIMDSMYSQKTMFITCIIIPFINKAPTFDSVSDQYYDAGKFNIEQLLNLTNVTDGNGGAQKLTMTAVSSDPASLSVKTQGSGLIKLTPKKNDTVTVIVTLKDNGDTYLGGKNSITRKFKVTCGTGIDALKEKNTNVTIFPNPFCDALNIFCDEDIQRYEITSANGVKYMSGIITGDHYIINTSVLPAGIYFLRLTGEKEVITRKLIKE